MRQIEFRGKSSCTGLDIDIEKGDWVYGSLIQTEHECFIVNGVIESNEEYISLEKWCPVESETVGQYTGITDFKNNKIFEGDIIVKLIIDEDSCMGKTDKHICKVVYSDGNSESPASFSVICKDFWRNQGILCHNNHINKVIGNIYDNPKLLHESMREEIIENIESWESEKLT